MEFHNNLKKMMVKNGLSLKELSQKIDVSPSTIHGWVNGVPPRNIVLIYKLACSFDISIEELCFGKGAKTTKDSEDLQTNLKLKMGEDDYFIVLRRIRS